MRRMLVYGASTLFFSVAALAASEAEQMALADKVIALFGSGAEWRKVCYVRNDRKACNEALDEITFSDEWQELADDNEEMLETGNITNTKFNRMKWNLEVLENKLLEVQGKFKKE
jgi:hypothetical protein